MMDGISAMDTGNNGQMLTLNIESIAEVKVLTQGYQAEFGRSSGLQITAVTKSGTNRFRGSAYDLITDSDWNTNRKLNELNGDPKPKSNVEDARLLDRRSGWQARRQQQAVLLLQPRVSSDEQPDQQRQPDSPARADGRSSAPATSRRRSINNGALFPFIKDPPLAGACSATDQTACFRDGGVLGKIPANRLYSAGLAILNRYPAPNRTQTPGTNYNYQLGGTGGAALPIVEQLRQQPAIRLDYQLSSKLRVTGTYSGERQRVLTTPGNDPGLHRRAVPVSVHHQLRDHGELHAEPDDVPRRHLRVHPQRADRRQRERHPDERLVEPAERPRGLPAALSRRRHRPARSRTPTRCCRTSSRPSGTARR